MSKATQKRVVSKAEYARIMARNAMLTAITVGCLSVGFFVAFASLLAGFTAYHDGFEGRESNITAAALLGVSLLLFACGTVAKRKVENAEEVQPATRKIVEKLPSEEILVRGSEAPQTPETVLLRAAATTTETPQEQLLRPTE